MRFRDPLGSRAVRTAEKPRLGAGPADHELLIRWYSPGIFWPHSNSKESSMFDLSRIQAAIREDGLDGWLLYDFRGLNVLARRILDMRPDHMLSRRWLYF